MHTVDVFWTDRRDAYSVRIDGLVVGHADIVAIYDAEPQRHNVKRTSRKHHFLRGTLAYVVNYRNWDGTRFFTDPNKQWDPRKSLELHAGLHEVRVIEQTVTQPEFHYLDGGAFHGADMVVLTPNTIVTTRKL
jgi:hypothetical protein